MRRNLFFLLLSLIGCFLSTTAQQRSTQLNYSSGVYKLSEQQKQALKKFIAETPKEHISKIEIAGHTDDVGSSNSNEKLAQQRAQQVEQFLTSEGVSNELITSTYWGEAQPKVSNTKLSNKAINRRVEINIFQQKLEVKATKVEKNILEILEQVKLKTQRFCIDNNKDTVIVGEQGTILKIKANSINRVDKRTIRGCVTIELKEAYQKADMLLENLSTVSNGQLLETDGMIYVNASLTNSTTVLELTKAFTVLMPTDSLLEDAKLFDGERDPHSQEINWTLAQNPALGNVNGARLEDCIDFPILDGTPEDRCKFFFCKIKRFFGGKKAPTTNGGGQFQDERLDCADLDSLLKVYGLKSINELQTIIRKERIKRIEQKMEGQELSTRDMNYYIYNLSDLGWKNIDVFSKLNDFQKTNIRINASPSQNLLIKVVFKNYQFIAPTYYTENHYIGKGFPIGAEAWIVAFKTENEKTYLAIQPIKIKEGEYELSFEEVQASDLRKRLSFLNLAK